MATIYYTATTLDGFLATPDNSLSWLFEVPGADDAESSIPDFMEGVGPMAMGSTTYEWVVEHESLLDNPAKWTEWYGDKPTWVFTHRDLPVSSQSDAGVFPDEQHCSATNPISFFLHVSFNKTIGTRFNVSQGRLICYDKHPDAQTRRQRIYAKTTTHRHPDAH